MHVFITVPRLGAGVLCFKDTQMCVYFAIVLFFSLEEVGLELRRKLSSRPAFSQV